MEIKETAALRVLSARRRVTIPQVRHLSSDLAPRIEADAKRHEMNASGPWTFISSNLPKDGRTEFEIRLCLPVSSSVSYAGSFELLDLEPIMVASAIYRGPMRGIFTQGYAPLVREIENSRYAFSGESREVYHDWNGSDADYHQIEIQFGLAY